MTVKAHNIAKIPLENLTVSLSPEGGWEEHNQSMYLAS